MAYGVRTRVLGSGVAVPEAGVGVGVRVDELTLSPGTLGDCGQKLLDSSLLWCWVTSLSVNLGANGF